MKEKSILFVGQCYYNHYYLSRELRKIGWQADLLNMDLNPSDQIFYHGQDYVVSRFTLYGFFKNLIFFICALFRYNIFHFANAENLRMAPFCQVPGFYKIFGKYAEVKFLKFIGKKIFYTNNGCRDGVTISSFNSWEPYRVCDICPWKNRPEICSDEKNAKWGKLRNKFCDYIGILGGNRIDYNTASHVHESPWIYCLDKTVWNPDIIIPANYRLPFNKTTIKIFHSVGNYELRSHGKDLKTIKSTEIWFNIVNRLKNENYDVELIFFKDVPNSKLKYYQVQADIFVDMLTYGFFGANVREAMMLGKPAICFLRPEWLESMRAEVPDYVKELPVISATPETAYDELKRLIEDKSLRESVGFKMRNFGLKWHASDQAALKADKIYSKFL